MSGIVSKLEQTREPQYQMLLDIKERHGLTPLGLMINQAWRDDPKRLAFTFARYKFVAKMLSGRKNVLEIGCADAFCTRIVQQAVERVTVTDFDPVFIADVKSRMDPKWPFADAFVHDMLAGPPRGRYDAAYALDVLEHIDPKREHDFLRNLVLSLTDEGVAIIGIPSARIAGSCIACEQGWPCQLQNWRCAKDHLAAALLYRLHVLHERRSRAHRVLSNGAIPSGRCLPAEEASMMGGSFPCHACGDRASELAAPALEFLVGSDCTPATGDVQVGVCRACGLLQKNNSREWQALCSKIYGDYRVYHQAAGKEQKARGITDGQLAPRSELIANFLRRAGKLPQPASILDIGCGNGPFLRAINSIFPDWRITGSDINESFRKDILAIGPRAAFKNDRELKSGTEKFDVVSLIHCVEHISAPVAYLAEARRHLQSTGLLLIEVPDAEVNPFDLVVADHASHFSKATLARVIESAGYRLLACGNMVLGKEITALASPLSGAVSAALQNGNNNAAETARRNLSWLEQILDEGRALASASRPFGIFGTSIAGVWIGSALGESIDFFVDEDENRVGRDYFGAPILAPADVPAGATVFVCLEPKLAQTIAARHRDASRHYIAPPQL